MSLNTANQRQELSRRRFLVAPAQGGLAVTIGSLLAACGPTASAPAPAPTSAPASGAAAAPQAGPGGFSGGGTLKLLVRSHFVPAYDKWLDQWAADWGTKNKVEVQVDHILSADLAAKIAAEVAAGAGHDIYGLTRNGEPLLYRPHMVDVTDLATQIGQQYGGWIPFAETLGQSEGSWHAVPEYFIDFPALYRKDIFDAQGLKPIDTYDDLLKVGEFLKGIGNPIGIAINQKANDANNSWTGALWSFGGSVASADGKSVAINSPETRAMLTYAVELYNKTMTNEVLSWDATGNNMLLAS